VYTVAIYRGARGDRGFRLQCVSLALLSMHLYKKNSLPIDRDVITNFEVTRSGYKSHNEVMKNNLFLTPYSLLLRKKLKIKS
jgi:hypothetical protein